MNDLERAMKFYSFVFGCDFSKDVIHGNEMAFFPFKNDGNGIAGALAKGKIYKPSTSGALIYLATSNIDESLGKIAGRGGEILFPKSEVPNYGWVAEFKDCEGNRIALFQGA